MSRAAVSSIRFWNSSRRAPPRSMAALTALTCTPRMRALPAKASSGFERFRYGARHRFSASASVVPIEKDGSLGSRLAVPPTLLVQHDPHARPVGDWWLPPNSCTSYTHDCWAAHDKWLRSIPENAKACSPSRFMKPASEAARHRCTARQRRAGGSNRTSVPISPKRNGGRSGHRRSVAVASVLSTRAKRSMA